MTPAERIVAGPDQESVWDYPRPPRVEPCRRKIEVVVAGTLVASSEKGLRVLETSSPPTIYIPTIDIQMDHLIPVERSSYCEWKGAATYFDVVVGDEAGRQQRADAAAWTYLDPLPAFSILKDHVSFYPGRVGACYLGGEMVRPQEGGFYGGWITDDIVGPFKGAPGTSGW